MEETPRVLVIGLDGACWPLIEDWIEDGSLPTIKNLRETGLSGKLESSKPPITCPAWKCYTTGKNPGKLGVYWWNAINLETKEIEVAHAGRFDSEELWDYLNDNDITTGIIGTPLTWPPDAVDGFMVSGGPDAVDEDFYYPNSVENPLDDLEYKLHPDVVFAGDVEPDGKEVQGIHDLVEQRFELGKRLNKEHKPDFLQITTFYLNSPLQHYFYDDETAVKEIWEKIDAHIDDLADEFDYIVLMSDHGTTPVDKSTHLNAWLKENDYLSVEKPAKGLLADVGLTIQNIAGLLDRIGIKNLLAKSKLLRNIGESVFASNGVSRGLGGEATVKGVNWDKTDAIALPQGPVYLTKDRDHPEYKKEREQLIEEIRSIKDPETGKNVFDEVKTFEEIYSGNHLEKAPDIMALDHDNYHNRGGLYIDEFFKKADWKGNNGKHGLYLIHGPNIEPEERKASIYDLTPTILSLQEIETPENLDGEPLLTQK